MMKWITYGICARCSVLGLCSERAREQGGGVLVERNSKVEVEVRSPRVSGICKTAGKLNFGLFERFGRQRGLSLLEEGNEIFLAADRKE